MQNELRCIDEHQGTLWIHSDGPAVQKIAFILLSGNKRGMRCREGKVGEVEEWGEGTSLTSKVPLQAGQSSQLSSLIPEPPSPTRTQHKERVGDGEKKITTPLSSPFPPDVEGTT